MLVALDLDFSRSQFPAFSEPSLLMRDAEQVHIPVIIDFLKNRNAVEAMGESTDLGLLRLSFVHYTTQAEVQQLLIALDKLLD